MKNTAVVYVAVAVLIVVGISAIAYIVYKHRSELYHSSGLTAHLSQPSAMQLMITGAEAEGRQQDLPWNRASLAHNPN